MAEKKKKEKYTSPKVSRLYRFDWQYAIDRSRLPFLRPASLIIGFMPLIKEGIRTVFGSTTELPFSIWIYWIAAISFLISWTILTISCPQFLLEYRDFGQYKKRKHSHRWIVWEFYNIIKSLKGWKTITQETLHKKISFKCSSPANHLCRRLSPLFFKELDPDSIDVFYPINEGRDIYLPINLYGEKVVLSLQEEDPELAEKEKELFWILYTQAAKEKKAQRVAFWIFFYISLVLVACNVIKNAISFIF